MSRDAYYKHSKRSSDCHKRDCKVLEFTKDVRSLHPHMGGKKLHHEIKDRLVVAGLQLGRDRLFDVLRENNMLIKVKRRFQKTTYSRHEYAIAPNRIKNLAVTKPNQVFVSDITYITLGRGFCYLYLLTDLCSRKILGYELSSRLTHKGAVAALQMATKKLPVTANIIHHSDRGCQYCCNEFLQVLKEKKMLSSMTDESHCYQNAVAERVNGILKLEYYLDSTFKSLEQARLAVKDAINIYNSKRIHWSLKLKTPDQVYSLAA